MNADDIEAFFATLARINPQQTIDHLVYEVSRQQLEDDCTLLLLRRRPGPGVREGS